MRIIFFLILFFVPSAFATLNEYFTTSPNIRGLGMGGAIYNLSDDDAALFYNPAGFALYRGKGGGYLSIAGQAVPESIGVLSSVTQGQNDASLLASKLEAYQGTPHYLAVTPFFPYYIRKNFGIGLLAGDTKLNFMLGGKGIDSTLELAGVSDSGLFIGFAQSFFENHSLHVGTNLKFMGRAGGRKTFTVEDIAKKGSLDFNPHKLGGYGAGIDFDFGVIFDLPELPFGTLSRISANINNVLANRMTWAQRGGAVPGLPRTLNFGTHTYFAGWDWFDSFLFSIDFAEFQVGGEQDPAYGARQGNFFKHLNLGFEAPMRRWFIPRLGIHQGYFTTGFGIHFRAFKFDFATYEEELGYGPGRLSSRRYAVRIQVGWGDAPPPPLTSRAELMYAKPEEERTETIEGKAPEAKPAEPTPPPAKEEIKPSEPPKEEKKDEKSESKPEPKKVDEPQPVEEPKPEKLEFKL